MAQREWVEKDFYKILGVSSDADEKEIKRAARKILADNHPDRNPDDAAAEERYKAASEAKEVLGDTAKRKEYDETRRLFAGGGFGRGRYSGQAAGTSADSVATAASSISTTCSTRQARPAAPTSAICSAGCSAVAHNSRDQAGLGEAMTWRPRPNCRSWRPPRVWPCHCG